MSFDKSEFITMKSTLLNTTVESEDSEQAEQLSDIDIVITLANHVTNDDAIIND